METYDIVMIAVLVAATLFGAWKGLAWQVASLAAIGASYYVAYSFRDRLAEHIHAAAPWNVFIAMLVLYVGTSFVIWVLFRLVSRFIDRVKLKDFDRQIGALFGLAKGALLCVIITLFAVTLLGDEQRQAIIRSRSGYYIAVLLDKADRMLPEEVHDVLHPYIHEFDAKLQPAGQQSAAADPGTAEPGTALDGLLRAAESVRAAESAGYQPPSQPSVPAAVWDQFSPPRGTYQAAEPAGTPRY
ncbi:MAG: CvpA family protein [Pirellulaceae bacterium]